MKIGKKARQSFRDLRQEKRYWNFIAMIWWYSCTYTVIRQRKLNTNASLRTYSIYSDERMDDALTLLRTAGQNNRHRATTKLAQSSETKVLPTLAQI